MWCCGLFDAGGTKDIWWPAHELVTEYAQEDGGNRIWVDQQVESI
jgi:hypothetical protein